MIFYCKHSIKIFKEAPLYSHKEILFLLSATSTCDPGDIFSTIEKIKNLMITCSIIHFSGSSYISQFLADKTEGKFEVPLDEEQFKNMISVTKSLISSNKLKFRIMLIQPMLNLIKHQLN